MAFREIFTIGTIALAITTGAAAQDNPKSIAIVSQLGSTLRLEQQGLFSNAINRVSIRDWQIDAEVEKTLTKLLSPRFRISSGPLPCLPEIVPDACNTNGSHDSGPDEIVVVSLRDGHGLGVGPGQVPLSGIGVIHIDRPIFRSNAVVHVLYTLSIIDAETGGVIDTTPGMMSETVFGGEHAEPIRDISGDTWPESPGAITDQQKLTIKENVLELLDDSLSYSVSKLHFTVQ